MLAVRSVLARVGVADEDVARTLVHFECAAVTINQ